MDQTLFGHRFVLSARNTSWESLDQELDLTGKILYFKCYAMYPVYLINIFFSKEFPQNVSFSLVRWLYTDNIEIIQDNEFNLGLLRMAKRFDLLPLAER